MCNLEIPTILYKLIAWIVSPKELDYVKDRDVEVSESLSRKVSSIAQDVINCATNARIKTPKHYILPLALKSLTGSAEVVTILNRLGHGLLYSIIEEVETALAEMSLQEQNQISLPSICKLGVPAVFCWDNNDIQEETLSGHNTTHCTNGIVIQRKTHSCEIPNTNNNSDYITSKRRSFKLQAIENTLFIPGNKIGPKSIPINTEALRYTLDDYSKASQLDFAWLLHESLFDIKSAVQSVPSWTSFNVSMNSNDIPRECVVGYCQTLKSSPTELSTVYTLLAET